MQHNGLFDIPRRGGKFVNAKRTALRAMVGIAIVVVFISASFNVWTVGAVGVLRTIAGTQYAQWFYSGTAYYNGSIGGIVLTPPRGNSAGAAWFDSRISLTSPFNFTFLVYLGNNDGGADGIAFVLQNTGTSALGKTGGSVGYEGISPSVAVKIDTWGTSEDYIVLMINGSEVGERTYIGNVEDGNEHLFRVAWNPVSETLHVTFDDKSIVYNVDILHNIGMDSYFGLTGGTGYSYNLQYFKAVSLTGVFLDPIERHVYPPDAWKMNGDAHLSGDSFILTKNEPNSIGAVWFKKPLSLSDDFDMTFRVYISDSPGDGMAFVLQSYGLDALGGWGFNNGYVPISPSVAIKIDADFRLDVYKEYYLAIMVNGMYATDPVPIKIKDGREHTLRVVWSSSTKTLTVYYDDEVAITRNLDLASILDSPSAYFGFTGATGGGNIYQYVQQVNLEFVEGWDVREHRFVNPSDWQYEGRAEYSPQYDAIKIGEYTSSADGSVWYKTPLDIRKPFRMSFLVDADFYKNERSRLLAFAFRTGNSNPLDGLTVKFYPGEPAGTTYVEVDWREQELYKSTFKGMYPGVNENVTFSWSPSINALSVEVDGKTVARTTLPDAVLARYLNRPVYVGFVKSRDTGAMLIKPVKLEFSAFNMTTFEEEWTLVGDAKYSMGNFILTENREHQRGAVWYKRPVDVSQPFSVEMSVYLGSNHDGADGIAFVIQGESDKIVGLDGGNVGYVPILPSVAVKIDTSPESLNSDYMVLMINGTEVPETIRPLDNVKDGQEHLLRVSYDGKTLSASLDGHELINYRMDIESVLGSKSAYIGATAGTGAKTNEQYVRFVNIDASFSTSAPIRHQAQVYNNLTYSGSAYYDSDSHLVVLGKDNQIGAVWLSKPVTLKDDLKLNMILKPPYGDIAVILQREGTDTDLNSLLGGRVYPSIVIGIQVDEDTGAKLILTQNGIKLYEKVLSIKNAYSAIPLSVEWDSGTSTLTLDIEGAKVPIKISSNPVDVWTGDFYLGVGAKIKGDLAAVKFLNVSYTAGNLGDVVDEWVSLGNSELRPSGEILLVPASQSKGAVWYRNPINLSNDFIGEFLFGGQSAGGDLVSIVFQNVGLGMFSNEPYTAHIDIKYGSKEILLYYNGTELFRGGLPKIDDGKMHLLKVGWNASSKKLWFEVDGSKIFSQKVDLMGLLGETAYVGFYASNGCCSHEKYLVPLGLGQLKLRAALVTGTSNVSQTVSEGSSGTITSGMPSSEGSSLKWMVVLLLVVAGAIVLWKKQVITPEIISKDVISKIGDTEEIVRRVSSKGADRGSGVQGFPKKLLKKYRPLKFIGAGGFGEVYKVKRLKDGKVVAVKIPKIDERTSKIFIDEVAAWRNLNHKNIVRLYEADILPIPHLEMEYVDGANVGGKIVRSLNEYPREHLTEERVLGLIEGIARGLQHAHSKGIYHRDLKPNNVLLTSNLTPKITDWGLAKFESEEGLTTKTVRGYTPLYAAPEQLNPEKYGRTGPHTDLWQLGVIFYELLTGRHPFKGVTEVALYDNITRGNFKRPSEINPRLKKYDRVISKLLAVDPSKRYKTVDQFLKDLEKLKGSFRPEEDALIIKSPSEKQIPQEIEEKMEELRTELIRSKEMLRNSRTPEERLKNKLKIIDIAVTMGLLALSVYGMGGAGLLLEFYGILKEVVPEERAQEIFNNLKEIINQKRDRRYVEKYLRRELEKTLLDEGI